LSIASWMTSGEESGGIDFTSSALFITNTGLVKLNSLIGSFRENRIPQYATSALRNTDTITVKRELCCTEFLLGVDDFLNRIL
jgi:hypothetical protein